MFQLFRQLDQIWNGLLKRDAAQLFQITRQDFADHFKELVRLDHGQFFGLRRWRLSSLLLFLVLFGFATDRLTTVIEQQGEALLDGVEQPLHVEVNLHFGRLLVIFEPMWPPWPTKLLEKFMVE